MVDNSDADGAAAAEEVEVEVRNVKVHEVGVEVQEGTVETVEKIDADSALVGQETMHIDDMSLDDVEELGAVYSAKKVQEHHVGSSLPKQNPNLICREVEEV